jgi:hypothetical protein
MSAQIIQLCPTRYEELLRVERDLGQAIERLELLKEMDLARDLRKTFVKILDLEDDSLESK